VLAKQHALALALDQPARELRTQVVVLPAPCRPASSSTTGGCARSFQGVPDPPMSLHQLGVQNTDERLSGVRLAMHLGAERLGPDRLDE